MNLTTLPSPQALAVASEPVGISQHVSFIVTGFLFVVVVLSILTSITWLIGIIFRKAESAVAAKNENAQKKQISSTPTSVLEDPSTTEGPYSQHKFPDHIPVILAAAAHTILKGKPHRIVNIRNVNQRWAQEGRRDIFSSHKLR